LHSSGKTTFKGGGPGLGLAIVRGVARAHGGRAWVESAGHDEVNLTGSTFYLLLPLAPPQPST
jgi:signal transduction histidine kinase